MPGTTGRSGFFIFVNAHSDSVALGVVPVEGYGGTGFSAGVVADCDVVFADFECGE